ncbi:hypothetical protein F5Y19DRAFT_450445 [Xylariaceae sp. FL1651]|nr:hypothetical protein F5Y19DRAFT_450445 [Xylariaceae sp. FL1651]
MVVVPTFCLALCHQILAPAVEKIRWLGEELPKISALSCQDTFSLVLQVNNSSRVALELKLTYLLQSFFPVS